MSCQHEWTESIRCAKCGQGIESRAEGITALSRELDAKDTIIAELRDTVARLEATLERVEERLAKFAGPRCDLCGNLCIDAAKDENGYCPDCAEMGTEIASAGYHP